MRKLLMVVAGASLAIGLMAPPVSAASDTGSSDQPITAMRDGGGRHGGGHGGYRDGRRGHRGYRDGRRGDYRDGGSRRHGGYYGDPYYDRYNYDCYYGRGGYYRDYRDGCRY